MYPDPKTVGVNPAVIVGTPPGPVTPNRYGGVSEWERLQRIQQDQIAEIEGFEKRVQPQCPLCENDPKTPCGKCESCLAELPCELTLCRHCVQPRSKNMGSNCDLTAGDEPCGTCDACREHRSDPCEHADDGYGPLGEFNPYHEPRILSAIPRPILDTYNNGARKFPVYYNPAPYYRPTWNPSLFTGYARPYTFRWTCEHCKKDPCACTKPGNAGQTSYAYACKFCRRNPCACAAEICNANKPQDPVRTGAAIQRMRDLQPGQQATEIDSATSGSSVGAVPTTNVVGGNQSANGVGSSDTKQPETKSATPSLYEDDESPKPVTPAKPKPELNMPTPVTPSPLSAGSES
ncbi:hypothetical protein FACS189443_0140 [Planctomycetales bacterium]|nr:hypothetical protein FACS189443_0140 [Planctomycetales bacterium]